MKTLKIHTLNMGWCDRDYMLLHAAFQLLVDFVDREKPDQIVDWNSDAETKRAWKEIQSLYRWWKLTRPARKSPLDKKGLKRPPLRLKKKPGLDRSQIFNYSNEKYADYNIALKKHMKLTDKWHKEDQANLHRLIEIRPFLWT